MFNTFEEFEETFFTKLDSAINESRIEPAAAMILTLTAADLKVAAMMLKNIVAEIAEHGIDEVGVDNVKQVMENQNKMQEAMKGLIECLELGS